MIHEQELPPDVELVWHGVDSKDNLRRFLDSSVRWAEVDLRFDARIGDLVFHHDPINVETPPDLLLLRDVLSQFRQRARFARTPVR
jgi:hypothetical protein